MKILHVSQGIPPFRVGGLNRYCIDLMEEQVKQGNEVSILYPGSYSFGKTRIKREKKRAYNIYSIINPLPMALIFGINAPERYMEKCDSDCYWRFLKENKFDAIHVHCTMGVHKEFFEAAKKLKIPMLLTAHDYYLLCPKCTFWHCGNRVCDGASPEKCTFCNQGMGLSRKMEILMQSKLYEKLKYSSVFKKLRKKARGRVTGNKEIQPLTGSQTVQYQELLKYNHDILSCMDMIHCNSSLTRSVYEDYDKNLNYITIPITHANLPKSAKKESRGDFYCIGYLGGSRAEKGFDTLMDAAGKLEQQEIKNWKLYLYGGDYSEYLEGKNERYRNSGMFSEREIQEVFEKLDIIIVPSICYETFSFVVLEALASGITVICSDHVGAKDLLDSPEKIFEAGDSEALYSILAGMLTMEGSCRNHGRKVKTMKTHAEEILLCYNKIGGLDE